MKKNETLDVLRGLFLVVMALNHHGGPLSRLTREPFGFVSAAEGFLFLSGLATGLAYAAPSFPSIAQRAFRKTRRIYLYHLLSLFFVLALVHFFPLYAAESRWSDRLLIIREQPLSALLLGAALLYRPTFLDILPMYILLMLVVPFLIRRYQEGRSTAVLAISFSLWGFSQTEMKEIFTASLPGIAQGGLGYFDLFAWQFLFVLGTWLGFTRRKGAAPSLLYHRSLVAIALTIGLFLFLVRHQPALLDSAFSIQEATEKSRLGWMRLINTLLLAYLVDRLVQTAPHLVRWQWLAFLGKHPLPVFTYHVLMLYLLEFFVRESIAQYSAGPLLLSALFILSLAFPAWAHRHYTQRKPLERPAPAYRVEGNQENGEDAVYTGTK